MLNDLMALVATVIVAALAIAWVDNSQRGKKNHSHDDGRSRCRCRNKRGR